MIMPGTCGRRGACSVGQALSLAIVVVFFLFTVALLAPAAQGQGLPGNVRPSSKALSFSRRGLENANRLIPSDGMHGGADGVTGEEVRPRSTKDLVLGDTVIVSSVEGGIYGLDRSSGRSRWSLAPRIKRDKSQGSSQEQEGNADINTTTFGGAVPAGFGPLIGSSYGPDRRSFSDLASNLPLVNTTFSDSKPQEKAVTGHETLEALQELGLYIVEPSAGQVYVLTTTPEPQGTTKTSLAKLPLTLPQLVELSPFSFPGDNTRVFVGHKTTSLVEIDIQSGKIGAVFGGGQDTGVWCDSPVEGSSDGSECGHDRNSSEEWAYIGRTG